VFSAGALLPNVELDNRPVIALIDDDPIVRRALQRVLATMDFVVAPFGSAEAFLASNRNGEYDCILLDLQLRGLSGLELYKRLTDEGEETPVIFISASADALHAISTKSGSRCAQLLKPLDADQLRAALDRTVRSVT
jgi:FixJ family two-component response regulator